MRNVPLVGGDTVTTFWDELRYFLASSGWGPLFLIGVLLAAIVIVWIVWRAVRRAAAGRSGTATADTDSSE